MAKVSSLNSRENDARFAVNKCRWRLLPAIAMESTSDVLLAVSQNPETTQQQGAKGLSEKDILMEKKYSDIKENLRSLSQIVNAEAEESPFYL